LYGGHFTDKEGKYVRNGKTHIVIMWTVGLDGVTGGDRLLASHARWMTGHTREGDMALRSYSISKGPELSNPLAPDSSPTGNTIFVLDEFYESPAGPVEHWRLARSSDPTEGWPDVLRRDPGLIEWSAKTKVCTVHSGTVVPALW
jgi:hypothetical protein